LPDVGEPAPKPRPVGEAPKPSPVEKPAAYLRSFLHGEPDKHPAHAAASEPAKAARLPLRQAEPEKHGQVIPASAVSTESRLQAGTAKPGPASASTKLSSGSDFSNPRHEMGKQPPPASTSRPVDPTWQPTSPGSGKPMSVQEPHAVVPASNNVPELPPPSS